MSSKMLSWLIRFAVVACAIGGVFLCVYGYPKLGALFVVPLDPDSDILLFLWLILLYAVTVPCYIVLVMVWVVSIDVSRETAFSHRTAKLVGASSIIMLLDAAALLIGTIVLSLFEATSELGYLLLIIVAAGFLLGMFAAVLARYVTKAAALQEESEGTI